MTAPTVFYLGDPEDPDNLIDEPFISFQVAFSRLKEMLVSLQDDIDSGECEEASSLAIYSVEKGQFMKVFEGWPVVPATHIPLKDKQGYFSVSFGLLAGSLVGGQAKNWRLVSRFVEGDGSFTFLGLYKTKEVSAFVPFSCESNQLIVDLTHLMEKKELVPMDVPHKQLEFDNAELRALFMDQTRVSDMYSKATCTRATETYKGSLDTCTVEVTQPLGKPNNANAYTLRIETQQAMLLDGEERHTVELTIIGDWEITDFIEAVSAIPRPARLA